MTAPASSVLPTTIAALAISLSFSTLLITSAPARSAETCLAAPKGAAPQGSHWFYRLERATQRKCWRLVQRELKGRDAAARVPRPGDADDAEKPAAAPPPPAMKRSAARLTVPSPADPQPPVTKDAGNIKDM